MSRFLPVTKSCNRPVTDTTFHQRSGEKLLSADSIDSAAFRGFGVQRTGPIISSDDLAGGLALVRATRHAWHLAGFWIAQEANELCFRCKATTDGAADAVCFGAGAIDVLVRLTRSRQGSFISSPRSSNFQIREFVNLTYSRLALSQGKGYCIS